jgi:hypothetical protein
MPSWYRLRRERARSGERMSGSAVLEQAKHDAVRVVRNLPEAHASWQFFWRDAKFRRSILKTVEELDAIDVARCEDEDLDVAIEITELLTNIIDVHVSRLGGGVRDQADRRLFADLTERLRVAGVGFARGLAGILSSKRSAPNASASIVIFFFLVSLI